jgi:hypothetical protein
MFIRETEKNKMTETNLNYESVTLSLPGTLKETPLDKEILAVGSSVRFCIFDCHISAYVNPGVQFKNAELKQEYAQPIAQLVTRDLSTIDDLLPKLTELCSQRIAPDQLMYSKEPEGRWFRVYDCTSTPPGRVFPTMLALRETDRRFLNPALKDLANFPAKLGREEGKIEHVEGNSLRVALNSAIEIYKIAERVRSL